MLCYVPMVRIRILGGVPKRTCPLHVYVCLVHVPGDVLELPIEHGSFFTFLSEVFLCSRFIRFCPMLIKYARTLLLSCSRVVELCFLNRVQQEENEYPCSKLHS